LIGPAGDFFWIKTSQIKKRARHFLRDESGGVLDYVLVVGVISVPLVIFLAIFGRNVVEWVQENAPEIFKEATNWIGS
jgi:Flp pilus assembly pilin Flp